MKLVQLDQAGFEAGFEGGKIGGRHGGRLQLVRRPILPPLRPLDLLDCGHDPLPDGAAYHVALLKHSVGARCAASRAAPAPCSRIMTLAER